MPIYDFKCPKGHVTEELVKHSVRETLCPVCSEATERQVSAPHIDWQCFALGENASTPAIDKWDKMRRRKMAQEQKTHRNHGTFV